MTTALVLALPAAPARADGVASLIADINTSRVGSNGVAADASSPTRFTAAGGTVFFTADTPGTGTELYRTDGTAGGTALVKDINPGPGSSGPWYLAAVGGTLFFVAYRADTGDELWKSDGTAAGTSLVKELIPGFEPSLARDLTAYNGSLYFVAQTDGSQLWRSDGTVAGTQRVKDINPVGPDVVSGLTVIGDTLYFTADDGANGLELWRSDGTAPGTGLVKDITPGPESTDFFRSGSAERNDGLRAWFTEFGGKAFFVANAGLWQTDGTEAGTTGFYLSPHAPADLTAVGDTLFFSLAIHGRESYGEAALWTSDGTYEGTQALPRQLWGWFTAPAHLVALSGRLLFTSRGNDGGQRGLWTSDGTVEGTVLLHEVGPDRLVVVGDKAYFSGFHQEWDGDEYVGAGTELWESDGTSGGTHLVADINRGDETVREDENGVSLPRPVKRPAYSSPDWLTSIGGRLFFSADDGRSGREPWLFTPCPAGVAKSGKRCL